MYKWISKIALYFIFTYGEFSTRGESFFQLHSNTTLYFIFIFIKIIFLLFYFNFFFSLLISLFFFVLHSGDPRQTQEPRQTQDPRLTHAHAEINPSLRSTQIGTETKTQAHPEQTEAQIAAETKIQTHEQTEVRRDQNPSPPSTQPPPENQ